MSGTNDSDDIQGMQGHKPVPTGFLLFMAALVAWACWYMWSYTPELSGWSAYKVLAAQEGGAVTGHGGKGPSGAAAAGASAAQGDGNAFAYGDGTAAKEGEDTYRKECAGCHGDDMKNPSGGSDLRGTLKYGADGKSLSASVAEGRPGGMPDFAASLGAERIRKVVTYVLHERGGK